MLAQLDGVSGTSTIASVTLAAFVWLPQANVTLVGAFADCRQSLLPTSHFGNSQAPKIHVLCTLNFSHPSRCLTLRRLVGVWREEFGGRSLEGGRMLHVVLWGVSPFLATDLTVFSPGTSDMTGDGLVIGKVVQRV